MALYMGLHGGAASHGITIALSRTMALGLRGSAACHGTALALSWHCLGTAMKAHNRAMAMR